MNELSFFSLIREKTIRPDTLRAPSRNVSSFRIIYNRHDRLRSRLRLPFNLSIIVSVDFVGGGGNELPVVLTGFLQRENRIVRRRERHREEEEIEIEAFACRC